MNLGWKPFCTVKLESNFRFCVHWNLETMVTQNYWKIIHERFIINSLSNNVFLRRTFYIFLEKWVLRLDKKQCSFHAEREEKSCATHTRQLNHPLLKSIFNDSRISRFHIKLNLVYTISLNTFLNQTAPIISLLRIYVQVNNWFDNKGGDKIYFL